MDFQEEKMNQKKSFVLYQDYQKHVEKLSDEDAGRLFKGIFTFIETGESPALSPVADMAFSFISAQLQRDLEKWQEVCKKRAEAGRKSGERRRAKRTDVPFAEQNQPERTDTVYETVTATDDETVSVYENETQNQPLQLQLQQKNSIPLKPERLPHPAKDEIAAFATAHHAEKYTEKFYAYYSRCGWMTKAGLPVQDWKELFLRWIEREKEPVPCCHTSGGKQQIPESPMADAYRSLIYNIDE